MGIVPTTIGRGLSRKVLNHSCNSGFFFHTIGFWIFYISFHFYLVNRLYYYNLFLFQKYSSGHCCSAALPAIISVAKMEQLKKTQVQMNSPLAVLQINYSLGTRATWVKDVRRITQLTIMSHGWKMTKTRLCVCDGCFLTFSDLSGPGWKTIIVFATD